MPPALLFVTLRNGPLATTLSGLERPNYMIPKPLIMPSPSNRVAGSPASPTSPLNRKKRTFAACRSAHNFGV